MLRLWLCLLCVAISSPAFSAEEPLVRMGMSIGQVEELLGYPESRVQSGERAILLYKEGARFEFQKGALVSVRGFKGRIEFNPEPEVKSLPVVQKQPEAKAVTPPPIRNTAPAVDEPQGGLTHYGHLMQPARSALEQSADFVEAIFNPKIMDERQQFQLLGFPLLAGLVRMAMTLYSLQLASRFCRRHLSVGWLTMLALAEWLLRVTVAAGGSFLLGKSLSVPLGELATMLFFWALVYGRPEFRSLWISFKIAFYSKVAVLVTSVLLFMILLNLST